MKTLLGSLLCLLDNGNDYIYGAWRRRPRRPNGNDIISDVDGADTMSGGSGNDSISISDGAGGDALTAQPRSDTWTVDTGNTTSCC